MLVNTKAMLTAANDSNYAIPSPDYCNMNMVRAYVEAAQSVGRPLILAYSGSDAVGTLFGGCVFYRPLLC